MNTEVYSLATCPGTKYSGDTITLRATPRDGIGPYYVAFKKDGIIIDPSRLGGESNPITDAPENVEIVRTYTLNDEDVRNALTGTIDFSVFIIGSCPTGGGLQFDGADDYVNAGNAASLNIGNGAFAVELWINKLTQTTSYPAYIEKGNGDFTTTTTKKGIWLGERWPGGDMFTFSDGSSTSWNMDNNWVFFGDLTDKGWSHIVATVDAGYDVNPKINAYKNGVLVDTQNRILLGSIDTSYNLHIGKWNLFSRYFNGTIDEVRIYNRALSASEILNNYNGYISRDGLVLEHIYSLGNANDLSGYGNNGTPINGPVFVPNACMDICTVAIGCVAPVCNFVVT